AHPPKSGEPLQKTDGEGKERGEEERDAQEHHGDERKGEPARDRARYDDDRERERGNTEEHAHRPAAHERMKCGFVLARPVPCDHREEYEEAIPLGQTTSRAPAKVARSSTAASTARRVARSRGAPTSRWNVTTSMTPRSRSTRGSTVPMSWSRWRIGMAQNPR